jgi:putative tributyrin esterase
MLRTLLRATSLLLLVAARAGSVEAVHGTVRRDAIYSHVLGVSKNMLVYLPPSYDHSPYATKRYPVAIYLHGRWGDETDWLTLGHLAQSMDSLITLGLHEMIIVMPDGDEGWWTSGALPSDTAACRITPHRKEPSAEFCVVHPQYDEYLAREVLPYVDATFRTLPSRESRGIAGLSMGGYGAVAVAATYPELFSVAVSHGGALTPGMMADSSEFPRTGKVVWRQGRTMAELRASAGENEWNAMYPTFGLDSGTWAPRDPINMLRALKAAHRPMPVIYMDVPLDEGRVQQNRAFRDALRASQIPLTYSEWPGRHDWKYWSARSLSGLQFLSHHLAQDPSH